jgi:hypothetical protein
MITETPELDKLRFEACRTSDKSEFEYCYREYRRKGGLRKLVFVPLRKFKKTYPKNMRTERNGKMVILIYRNSISLELMRDCAELRARGVRFDDIALLLDKNYGYVKESTAKYASNLGRVIPRSFA